MKLLFITIIVLVIPIFFALVFLMSTVGKLTKLRNRCREIRSGMQSESQRDFNLAVDQYNAARTKFPAGLLAGLCGFQEIEPSTGQPVDGGSAGIDKRAH